MQVKGKVFKYGNDVDTDVIIPARYLNTTSESELAAHCMEDQASVEPIMHKWYARQLTKEGK